MIPPIARTGRRHDAASPSACQVRAPEYETRALGRSCLLPALDQLVVVDGLWLFLLVRDLELRREVALGNGILVPVLEIVLLGELRSDVALHACALQTLHDLLLLGAERVHRFLG